MVEIARVIRAAGKPVAYLIDVIAEGLIPDEAWGSSFRGSVLDLLLERGDLPLEYSRTEINAVAAKTKQLLQAFRDCGCTLNNPNMQLSLLALVVIPELRISDKGLIDVNRLEVLSLVEPSP